MPQDCRSPKRCSIQRLPHMGTHRDTDKRDLVLDLVSVPLGSGLWLEDSRVGSLYAILQVRKPQIS